jgi:hypothetical protein
MTLRELVERYRSLAGGFGRPVPLRAFGLSRADAERLFSAFDEDYHISRFFHFTLEPPGSAESYSINSFPQSHLSLDPEIESIL